MPRFTPEFLDDLRSRLRTSDVVGRYVKLKKEGREWRGLSPFTNEKTPSFFVNDDKAKFFDFSSGKSGDIIGFLMDTQKLNFVEAVTRLAEEAGLEIPKDTPEDARKAEQRKGLAEAGAAAAEYYQVMLARAEGRHAREYLVGREVPEDLQHAFAMGFAPNSKTALKDHLVNKGFALEQLVEAGLLIQPRDDHDRPNGVPYDRFRDRIMFPILDQRAKVIAFGGRAMAKEARAKYLNSPETPLFHKGSVLYNYMAARRAAADLPTETGQPLLVCEGYMDVIALAGAGFGNAVAPLGTALTENHLGLLWRACDEPIMCFDGDRAGRSAAHRSIDRALPLLKPGKSLRFAFLPDGQDPDDLVKSAGPAAFAQVLADAQPLAQVLWDREVAANPAETPEKKAAFRSHLRQLVRSISEKDVQAAYGEYFKAKLDQQTQASRPYSAPKGGFQQQPFRPGRPGKFNSKFPPRGGLYQPQQASDELKSRRPAAATRGVEQREQLLLLTLVNHPDLFAEIEKEALDLVISDPGRAALLSVAVQHLGGDLPDGETLDISQLHRHISSDDRSADTLKRLLNDERLRIHKFARSDATMEDALSGWRNTLALHLRHGPLRREMLEAASEAAADDTGEARWREMVSYFLTIVSDSRDNDQA